MSRVSSRPRSPSHAPVGVLAPFPHSRARPTFCPAQNPPRAQNPGWCISDKLPDAGQSGARVMISTWVPARFFVLAPHAPERPTRPGQVHPRLCWANPPGALQLTENVQIEWVIAWLATLCGCACRIGSAHYCASRNDVRESSPRQTTQRTLSDKQTSRSLDLS